MTLLDKIKYKSIARQITKASEQGFGGLTIIYAFTELPSLSTPVRNELLEEGIKISEIQWSQGQAWRRFYWGSGEDKVKKR